MTITKEEQEKILTPPTAAIPDAGRVLGFGRNAAYEAVNRGEIPVIRLGDKARVPTKWLRKQLMIED